MATAQVAQPSRHTTKATRSHTATASSDPFYGNESQARLCARFVSHLFACPEVPPSQPATPTPTPRLDHFIAYALHRTRLHPSVTFAALYLLQRLKARFPAAKGSSGHRLFISAFMIASKIICDDTYSNKSWCIVGQGMFALREINQMEREMCSYLEWQLNVEPKILKEFEDKVCRDFAGNGPYPAIVLPQPSPSPFAHAGASSSTSIPSFGHRTSPPKSTPASIPSPSTATVSSSSSPSTPDTPSASTSTSTSPASSASPQTPADAHAMYDTVKIVGSANSSTTSLVSSDAIIADSATQAYYAQQKAAKSSSPASSSSASIKSKASRETQYAFAARTVW